MNDRRAQRKALRAARAALPPVERAAAARRVAGRIAASGWLAPGRRVGLYAALADELDTAPLMALAAERRCQIYLPRIELARHRRMCFSPANRRALRNLYGIDEPATRERLHAAFLQVIFMPLIGYDARGNRLGMGAGFYDRLLAFRHRRSHWRGPLLVGLAYSCQEVLEIEPSSTDVALDAIVTEHETRIFRGAIP